MTCMYCQHALRGFADARTVNVNGKKTVACADLLACQIRVAERERARRGEQAAR